ncbi:hypothetical protein P3T36_000171 [Kitasatospora sp. MAP12-15]|nr:hypothetical protein [Kitasatospora sp. MAP12-44]
MRVAESSNVVEDFVAEVAEDFVAEVTERD